MSESIYEINERVSLAYPDDPAIQALVARVEQLAGVSNALEQARARGDNDPSVVWAAEALEIVEYDGVGNRPPSPWVSVKERLPEPDDAPHCYQYDDGFVHSGLFLAVGYFVENDGTKEDFIDVRDFDFKRRKWTIWSEETMSKNLIPVITHWVPIPEPPEADNGA